MVQAKLMRGIGAKEDDYVSPHVQHLASKTVYEMLKSPEDNTIELKVGASDALIERRNNAKNFSGDMFSGLGIATATRIKNRKLLKTDREKLIKLWNKTTFDKPVITFAHPKDGKEYSDRGELFSWYDLGSDILKLLAWFELGYQLTGDVRYRKWYKRFKFISMPLLWINIGAMDIAYGKYFIIRWYTYHSRILHMAAGYLTSEDPIFKRSAKAIYDRYVS